jgi:hypothetical protein
MRAEICYHRSVTFNPVIRQWRPLWLALRRVGAVLPRKDVELAGRACQDFGHFGWCPANAVVFPEVHDPPRLGCYGLTDFFISETCDVPIGVHIRV